jgi:hypothetical protein
MRDDYEWERDGFEVLTNVWPDGELDAFEQMLESRAIVMLNHLDPAAPTDNFYGTMSAIEKISRAHFYELTTQMGSTVSGMKLALSQRIQDFLRNRIGWSLDHFATIPTLFWNDPSVARLHYRWHQEASYLQAYDFGVHVWGACLRDLTEEDGPMYVLPGSHKLGLLSYEARCATDSVTQLEVPKEVVAKFSPIPCDIRRGEAVLFHQNLIHCTGTNCSKLPRASIVTRYFSTAHEPNLRSPLQFQNPKSRDQVIAAGTKAAIS